jgi:hypothetical protein
MKTLLIFLLLIIQVQAETLIESITEKNVSKAAKSIENGYKPLSEDEKRLNALAGTKKRSIDNISIKVIEKNVSKDLTVGVQYTPPLKHGNVIDNKENAEIKLEYKF